ncbi:hypothetical protein HNQ50_003092 [Silvimonas terrae]|uniref:Uncharacterized protein n=1 Tax=Silvimonas terrae TaxID=300266 RepID=A0A840RJL3_9NEIS|nr:hypothetical protein [Silvimonas terrae]MBB5192351.1 hypothetical protein [Silvimonas terrae]
MGTLLLEMTYGTTSFACFGGRTAHPLQRNTAKGITKLKIQSVWLTNVGKQATAGRQWGCC